MAYPGVHIILRKFSILKINNVLYFYPLFTNNLTVQIQTATKSKAFYPDLGTDQTWIPKVIVSDSTIVMPLLWGIYLIYTEIKLFGMYINVKISFSYNNNLLGDVWRNCHGNHRGGG